MKPVLLIVSIMLMAMGPGFAQQRKVHIYVLAGQSNMAGRGTPEAIDTTPYGGIRMLNKADEWVPAREPLHFDKPAVVGTGPGFAFARAIADKTPDADIYLVPCAVGGTRIDLWTPGAYDSATKTHPYDDAMRRIRKALPAGELKAIIWHQGESDCNEKLSAGYEQKLAALIQRFRSELNMPSLPFIMGEIAHFRTEPNPDKVVVNTAIRKVAVTLPYCGFVETNGLHHRGDSLHFDSPSARELGKRYAAAYLSMKKPS
jgi:hypothetical protein